MKIRKGFAIIYALIFVFLILLTITALATLSYNSLKTADSSSAYMRAHYLAEAGLAKKLMELKTGNTNSTSGTLNIATGISGTYSVTATLLSGTSFPAYRLDSTGTYRNATRRVSLSVKQTSCSRYSYLSNSEDQLVWGGSRPIWFTTGDVLSGPVYSNDQFNIFGDPIFEGAVSSAASTINYYHDGPPEDNPEFRGSLTLGAPIVQLPAFSNSISTAAQSGGNYFTGNTAVTLLSDGTMNVTNWNLRWTNHNVPIPSNGAVFVSGGYVDISGTLNGQLTVGTDNNIYVTGNTRYHSDPRTDPTSQDMLGLVSQNNVYVDTNAPTNLEIDAYIIALNSSFAVENYQYGLKGTLTLYGGITQVRRGAIGTFSSTTGDKVSGYTKNYVYDQRLLSAAPLYFTPMTDNIGIVYIKTAWSES